MYILWCKVPFQLFGYEENFVKVQKYSDTGPSCALHSSDHFQSLPQLC